MSKTTETTEKAAPQEAMTLKNFRSNADIENFYRYIHDNGLRREAFMMMESPFCIKVLLSPLLNSIGFCPFQVNSNKEPYEPGDGPLMVPEAYTSPTAMLHPLIV